MLVKKKKKTRRRAMMDYIFCITAELIGKSMYVYRGLAHQAEVEE